MCSWKVRSAQVALFACAVVLLAAWPAAAQPLVGLAQQAESAAVFIAPIASVVAVIFGGLAMAFSRGGHHETFTNVLIGCAIACAAVAFVAWIPRG
jgi:hypothetical protein